MGLNLHAIVRGAITTVNPDTLAQYLASTGATGSVGGKRTPTYAAAVPLLIQVQPLSRGDTRHLEGLNIQGVGRSVFLYGNAQAVVRNLQIGGDLFQFPQFAGQANSTWLVVAADGPWNVPQGGWTKILVILQAEVPA